MSLEEVGWGRFSRKSRMLNLLLIFNLFCIDFLFFVVKKNPKILLEAIADVA